MWGRSKTEKGGTSKTRNVVAVGLCRGASTQTPPPPGKSKAVTKRRKHRALPSCRGKTKNRIHTARKRS